MDKKSNADNVTPLKPVVPQLDDDVLLHATELLDRVRSGETLAIGIVEVRRNGEVASSYAMPPSGFYHQLLSGVSRLLTHVALIP